MSNFIGGYPQITEVGGGDLLPVIQGGELKNATRNSVLGYSSLMARFTQAGTSNPVLTTLLNTTAHTFSFVRGGVGYYETTCPSKPYLMGGSDFQASGPVFPIATDNGVDYDINYYYFYTYEDTGVWYLGIAVVADDVVTGVEFSTAFGASYLDLPEIKFFA
jgi:hypothetical protein